MTAETYNYNLLDDGGCSTLWDIPFQLEVGAKFKHEYGTYEVTDHTTNEGANWVNCERIAKPES